MLKLPALQDTRLYDKLIECLSETGEAKQKEDQQTQQLLLIKNLKLFVQLYQFLPGKKQSGGLGQSTSLGLSEGRARNKSHFNTIHAGGAATSLDLLKKDAVEIRMDVNRDLTQRQFGKNDRAPDMTETQKTELKAKLNQLAQRIIDKFGKVSSAFRAFDVRTRGAVTFSDFAYVIDQLKLKFERDLIMQIFTYMDSD